MKIRNVIIAAGVAAGLGVGLVACGTDTTGNDTVSERPTPGKAEPEKKETTPTSFRSGKFLVGTDIKAGTYKTAGPAAGGDQVGIGCYWERTKDDSGEFDSIIANEIVDGPGRVTVNAGEVFKTTGDCIWKLVA